MEGFEDRMERACKDLEIPGAVLVARDSSGKFNYTKSFGVRTLKDPANPDPLTVDATMWIASCTKLMTSIAALQCVERGLIKLDDDVTTILPELKDLDILTGFEEGTQKPILVRSTKTITLKHLLTHSSGLAYDIFNPTLMKYSTITGRTPAHGGPIFITEAYKFPLLFEPGEGWEYGVGIDWSGKMVERLNDNMTLEAYMKKNIWGPLGIKNITFHPIANAEVMAKLSDTSVRAGGVHPVFGGALDPEGKVAYQPTPLWDVETKDCYGGAGCFANMLDYQKVLQSIVSDDGKLLKSATVDQMFTPQLTKASQKSLMQMLTIKEVNNLMGGLPMGSKVDWGLGGMMNLETLGPRNKGSLCWGGLPNLLWWMDRVGGMSGIYGGQIYPPGDPKTVELFNLWEKEMYRECKMEMEASKASL